MKKVLFVLALFATVVSAAFAADIKVTTSLNDGDKVSGVVTLKVTALTEATVNNVEFYINGKLRGTDSSTPYTLTIDTVTEKEGPIEIEIGVYTSTGDQKKVKLKLIVDNDLAKGGKYHTDNAVKFLQVSKWDDAIQACRIALKADENFVPAKLAMARAFFGKEVYDEAQKWGEDALLSGETSEVLDLLSGIHANRAFGILSLSGDKGDALKEIARAMKASILMRHKSLDLQIKAMGAVNDDNRLKIVDLLMQKNEYSAARRLLREKYKQTDPDLAIANRLIFAEMRSGRMADAYKVTEDIQKYSAPDGTTWGLIAAGQAYYRQFEKANEALRNATLSGDESPSLMTAAAFLALRKNDRGAMGSQITQMLRKSPSDAEVFYYIGTLQYMTGQRLEAFRNFRNTLVRNPLLYDAYVQRGYEALLSSTTAGETGSSSDKDLLIEQGKQYMELALVANPASAEALNGLAIVNLLQNKVVDAVSMAEAAVRAGPEYPWAWFTYSCALDKSNTSNDPVMRNKISKQSSDACKTAGTLDKASLAGRNIPTVDEAWRYSAENARIPTLIPPK